MTDMRSKFKEIVLQHEYVYDFAQEVFKLGAASVQGEQEPVAYRDRITGMAYPSLGAAQKHAQNPESIEGLYTAPVPQGDVETRLQRAEKSLISSGFQDLGGELWKPPLGKPPIFIEVPQGEQCQSELREALRAALEWIDAVPSATPLPTMPGFDRDWVDGLLAAQPKESK